MWICARCGEPHQDQFKECWKCVGAEIEGEEHVAAGPPPPSLPARERPLRSAGSIVLRAAVGFLVGVLLSLSSFNFINFQSLMPGQELSPAGRTVLALIVGLILGAVVGLLFWVVFPYEPPGETPDSEANE